MEYRAKTNSEIRAIFNGKLSRHGKSKIDFKNSDAFYTWYSKQKKICAYCGISEIECQKIIVTGKLKSKRFPINGQLSRGKNRGMWLEVERKTPNGKYSKLNCVLACYFCNNDKSDVFDFHSYKKFISNRLKFLKSLLRK